MSIATMPTTVPSIERNRMTAQDREALGKVISETVAGWHRVLLAPYVPVWQDAISLERIARHAMGCSEADLRVSELAEIHAMALAALGLREEA